MTCLAAPTSLTSRKHWVGEVSLNVLMLRRCLQVLREGRETRAPQESLGIWYPLVERLWVWRRWGMMLLLGVDCHGFIRCHSRVHPA